MLINYLGHAYFYLQGNDYSIALDPFGKIGLPEKSVKADYVFCSHNHYDHNNTSLTPNAKLITKSCDRFEIIPTYHDEVKGAKRGLNNVIKFTLDNKTCVFMGDIGVIDNNVIEKVKGCDFLFIPVGGVYTINYEEAKRYVDEIKPKTIVPMHYKIKGCSVDVDGVDKFLTKFASVSTVTSPYDSNNEIKNVLLIKAEL